MAVIAQELKRTEIRFQSQRCEGLSFSVSRVWSRVGFIYIVKRLGRVSRFATIGCVSVLGLAGYSRCLMAQDSVPTEIAIQNRTGDVPYSSQIGSQFEHVELSSGNLIVTIPFVSLPGRRMPFNYGIRYDAAYWVQQDGPAGYYWNPEMRNWLTSTALGWTSTQPYETYQTGQMTCYTGASDPHGGTGDTNPFGPSGSRTDGVIFTDDQGSKHLLLNNAQSNGECTNGSYNFNNVSGPSLGQDGFWATGWNSAVIGPDGTRYAAGGTSGGISYPNAGAMKDAYFLDMATATDTRGNTEIVAPNNIDTVGRTPITQQTNGNQIIYTVNDSNGNPQTYTVNLEPISVSTNFASTVFPITEFQGTRTTVHSVVLPNLQTYTFTYDSYGDITQITLPTGGSVSYQWANGSDGSLRSVVSRTVNDGVTSSQWNMAYTYSASVSNYTVTLTSPPDPQGTIHTTVYYYSNLDTSSPILTSVVYDPSGNSFLRKYDLTYYPSPSFTPANLIGTPLLKSIVTTLEDGTVSKKEFDYDVFSFERVDIDCTGSLESSCEAWATNGSFPQPEFDSISHGNVTAIREYAGGSGSPGPLTRQTIRKYLQDYTPGYGMTPGAVLPPEKVSYTGVNVVDKPIDETIYDGAVVCTGTGTINYTTGTYTPPPSCTANKIAEKSVQYDNLSPSSYGYHGEETAELGWLNSTNSFLTTTYVHDGFGNLTSITDPKTNITSIGYSDSFPTGISKCGIGSNSAVYPTSVTDSLGHKRQLSYYGCSGKISADQDPNDIAAGRAGTTYTYDEMGRVHVVTQKDLGQTTNNYVDTYPSSVNSTTLLSTSASEVSIAQNDGLGRVVLKTISSDPVGPSSTVTTYDMLGKTYAVSNPFRGSTTPVPSPASNPALGWTETIYDGLGRPTQITNQDNSTRTIAYSGLSTTSTDENSHQWTRVSDALGRLVKVLEPDGAGSSPSVETDYAYDTLSNLTSVNQHGSSGSTARVRSFSYDSLSRLLCASNPENSTAVCPVTNNGYVAGTVGYTYDANSNVQTKTDARGVVTGYSYDTLNRLLSKTYTNAPAGTMANCYQYDTAVNGVVRLGFEWTQSASCPTTPPTTPPTSGYQSLRVYGAYDAMGRAVTEQQCVAGYCTSISVPSQPTANCSALSSAAGLQYCYDLAGNLLAYSNGLTTQMAGQYPTQALLFTQTFDAAGRLNSVGSSWSDATHPQSLFSSPVYTPFNALSSWLLGTQLSTSRTYDNRLRVTGQSSAQ